MPKKKINRPNLSLFDIKTRDNDYAKHNRCGGIIAHARDERTLRCLSCEQKVGKRGSTMIREQGNPVLEHISGMGVMGVYFYPSPPTEAETTDDACTQVIQELKVDVAGSRWAVESKMFQQQYEPTSQYDPTLRGQPLAEGVETGRLASYGSKAAARAQATAKRIRNIEGRKKRKSSSQWDRTSKAADMGRKAARGRAEQMLASGQDRSGPYLNQPRPLPEQALKELAAGKGLHPHFERLSRARHRASPKDESLLARVQALEPRDRGGYMNQTLTEPVLDAAAQEARVAMAREEIEESQLSGDAAPDWAVRAVKQHEETQRAGARHLKSFGGAHPLVPAAMGRIDSGYVNAKLSEDREYTAVKAKHAKAKADWIKSIESLEKKRYYEGN